VPLRYAVRVSDREDGTLRSGRIPARRVAVSAQYLKDGAGPAASPVEQGRQLIEAGDCLSCHQLNRKSLGPTYRDVARKYQTDTTAMGRLSKKIREGGSGVWGPVAMPAHPALSDAQAAAMVAYIMSLADSGVAAARPCPCAGRIRLPRAPVTLPMAWCSCAPRTPTAGRTTCRRSRPRKTLQLRSPTVIVASGAMSDGVSKQTDDRVPIPFALANRSGSSVALRQIDLTGIGAVTLQAAAPAAYQAKGGKIAVYLDGPTGTLLVRASRFCPPAMRRRFRGVWRSSRRQASMTSTSCSRVLTPRTGSCLP